MCVAGICDKDDWLCLSIARRDAGNGECPERIIHIDRRHLEIILTFVQRVHPVRIHSRSGAGRISIDCCFKGSLVFATGKRATGNFDGIKGAQRATRNEDRILTCWNPCKQDGWTACHERTGEEAIKDERFHFSLLPGGACLCEDV